MGHSHGLDEGAHPDLVCSTIYGPLVGAYILVATPQGYELSLHAATT